MAQLMREGQMGKNKQTNIQKKTVLRSREEKTMQSTVMRTDTRNYNILSSGTTMVLKR